MEGQQNNKLVLSLLGFIVLVGIAFGAYYYFGTAKKPAVVMPGDLSSATTTPQKSIVRNEEGKLVSMFPQNLVTEKNIRVIDSYTSVDGRTQLGYYQYVSARTVAQNVAEFKKFFTTLGWKVEPIPPTDSVGIVSASKNGTTFLASISKNTIDNSILVTLSISEAIVSSWPKDLPQEAGISAEITQFAGENGSTRFAREYESKKSVDENYKIFKDYLESHNWELFSGALNTPTAKELRGSKVGASFTIFIGKDSTQGNVVKVQQSLLVSH